MAEVFQQPTHRARLSQSEPILFAYLQLDPVQVKWNGAGVLREQVFIFLEEQTKDGLK